MNAKEWLDLSDTEREALCGDLNPYEEWEVFKAVEDHFNKEYGSQPGVESVFCGLASAQGMVQAITVRVRPGQQKTKLPSKFMGFPVLRKYGNPK
jgi:hypothetical protein